MVGRYFLFQEGIKCIFKYIQINQAPLVPRAYESFSYLWMPTHKQIHTNTTLSVTDVQGLCSSWNYKLRITLSSAEISLHKLPMIAWTLLHVSLSELTGLKFSYSIEEKQTNLQLGIKKNKSSTRLGSPVPLNQSVLSLFRAPLG